MVKLPRFAFEKFPGADAGLTTQMKSVGEAMGIGRTLRRGVGQGDALPRAGQPPRAAAARSAEPEWDRFDRSRAGCRRRRSRRRWPPSRACTPGSSTSGRVVADAERTLGGATRRCLDAATVAAAEAARHRRRPDRRAGRVRPSARCGRLRQRPACGRCSRRSTAAPPRWRRRRPTTTRPTRTRTSCRPRRAAERDHPRRRPQPDRPGHRVRLLLRPGRPTFRRWATTR